MPTKSRIAAPVLRVQALVTKIRPKRPQLKNQVAVVFQRTDKAVPSEALFLVMETQPAPCVISADRIGRGVVITFDDGKCALYSSDLLRRMFLQAEELTETDLAEPTSFRFHAKRPRFPQLN